MGVSGYVPGGLVCACSYLFIAYLGFSIYCIFGIRQFMFWVCSYFVLVSSCFGLISSRFGLVIYTT